MLHRALLKALLFTLSSDIDTYFASTRFCIFLKSCTDGSDCALVLTRVANVEQQPSMLLLMLLMLGSQR